MTDDQTTAPRHFIQQMIDADQQSGKYGTRVASRFPPEPNGHLHIGHAKSICLNFGLAQEYGGTCNLRFDDTNPETEDHEYVEAIKRDVAWLGFNWDALYHASDYFEQLYQRAEELIEKGLAYVDSQSEQDIRANRGTVTEAGTDSSYRTRSVEENLDLFRRMRAGEFADGSQVLRAKIDMAHPNMKMRDPLLYRIRHQSHYRTGDDWVIYPMYDFTHCLSDAFEHITHSLCTLEFENNREIYDWVLENTSVDRPLPEQTEFARLALSYTVMSKRKLLQLVEEGLVSGWDDPRMPTLAGLRRRGYTPESIRAFCNSIGVAKANSVVDVAQLEHAVRNDLNYRSPRRLCVLDPIKLVIENYPEDAEEFFDAPSFPHDIGKQGSRSVPFSRELWIEASDFMEDPPRKFFRLAPGREVRLRFAYLVTCTEVIKDDDGKVVEIRASYDPETRGGNAPDGRKVRGTIHWVSARHALPIEVRLYDRLFLDPNPDQGKSGPDFRQFLNPESLQVVDPAWIEPSVDGTEAGSYFQFERQGYFVVDPDSTSDHLVVNRTVPLRDSWAKRNH